MTTATAHCIHDLIVPLPGHLAVFGGEVTARVSGPEGAPLVVALGGISADRFVAEGRDGGAGWWPGLIGLGQAIDTTKVRVLGLNFPADPTGRLAPSTADQALILTHVLDAVEIETAELVIGASYGGMIALQLAATLPARVRRVVAISAPAAPHPQATAQRELQRRVVSLGLAAGLGDEALAIARGMAMLTYRTPEEMLERFTGGIVQDDSLSPSDCGAYLRARGEAYRSVMSPERFLSLSASIDRHRVDPSRITQPVLAIGAVTDQLVPPCQLQALVDQLPDGRLHLSESWYGHDMFLKEPERFAALVTRFMEE